MTEPNRRTFVKTAASFAALAGSGLAASPPPNANAKPKDVRVVVWDERQPKQKEAYPNFLGNQIADHLRKQSGLSVQSVSIDDSEQGVPDSTLDACDVLFWWGHVRHAEITPETGRRIVERIVAGRLSLVALHSAHWSTPFVEAMNERARIDARKANPPIDGKPVEFREIPPPNRYAMPKLTDRLTPWSQVRKFPDGSRKVELHLPYCCFPGVRGDGKPSAVRVTAARHPLAEGVPAKFEISRTEMYDEPFHVPEPDAVVFEECWAPGEWFRAGMVWNVGAGKVVYFRPGHETFPVFFEEAPLRIMVNAAQWLGGAKA